MSLTTMAINDRRTSPLSALKSHAMSVTTTQTPDEDYLRNQISSDASNHNANKRQMKIIPALRSHAMSVPMTPVNAR
ncbi:hypothetical protein BaRGS_00012549 [Batillaria attramentaria]|uniref:Uncharacterized protein n=1 Tax=Batillaria attramentaria TaxID=370345 RepID=A0ABD0L9A5_9CAEN